MSDGEIKPIPRAFQPFSKKQKMEYAREKAKEEESSFVKDPAKTKKFSKLYEEKVAKDLAMLGIKK